MRRGNEKARVAAAVAGQGGDGGRFCRGLFIAYWRVARRRVDSVDDSLLDGGFRAGTFGQGGVRGALARIVRGMATDGRWCEVEEVSVAVGSSGRECRAGQRAWYFVEDRSRYGD